MGGQLVEGPPKSAAGVRTVTFPAFLLADLQKHLREFAEPGPRGRVFVGPKGATPRRSNWSVQWSRATEAAGVNGLHFHDLRHTGNTMAVWLGASLRELMVRMGHGSTRAALIYQHASRERDQAIANGLDEIVKKHQQAERKKAKNRRPSGMQRARSARSGRVSHADE